MNTAQERALEYHQDIGEHPTLSSTIAAKLLLKSPAHAKACHPRLTDHPLVESSYSMSLGTTVHQMLLRDDRVDIWDGSNDFRSKAAQEFRDSSLAAGRVPVTVAMWQQAREIADAVTQNLKTRGPYVEPWPTPFTDGQAEYVIRYQDNGANCRAMLDWLRYDRDYIDDLKTTFDASPAKVKRHIFNMGYDIRAAFYIRAVMISGETGLVGEHGEVIPAIGPTTPTFRWVFVETKPPYPVTIATLTQRALESAWVKVDEAIRLWNECLESGVWPAYQPDTLEVDLPAWQLDAADRWGDVDIESEAPF